MANKIKQEEENKRCIRNGKTGENIDKRIEGRGKKDAKIKKGKSRERAKE